MSTHLVPEIEARRARRAYASKPIEAPVLDRVLTAATYAPSCANKQPWRFLVCDAPPALERARAALNEGNYWAKVAPVLIVVTTADSLDCTMSDNRDYAQFDTGMAVMNLMLQATREGLYAHPMAGFDPAAIRESFGIETEARVITVIAVGYPGTEVPLNAKHAESERGSRDRKPLSEVILRNEWRAIA